MDSVSWRGELLWPQELPDGAVIDVSEVVSLGIWVHDWLRAHPNRALVAGRAELRAQLARAGVPVRWYERPEQVAGGGVTPSEREMLWN